MVSSTKCLGVASEDKHKHILIFPNRTNKKIKEQSRVFFRVIGAKLKRKATHPNFNQLLHKVEEQRVDFLQLQHRS